MHHSRLYGLFVDAPLGEAAAAVAFWGAALGVTPVPGEDDDPYTVLPGAIDGLILEVQAVDDGARFHLDIETDDVEAEARRLVALGAVIAARPGSWVILRAPGGHVVCVVPVQSERDIFDAKANTWQ